MHVLLGKPELSSRARPLPFLFDARREGGSDSGNTNSTNNKFTKEEAIATQKTDVTLRSGWSTFGAIKCSVGQVEMLRTVTNPQERNRIPDKPCTNDGPKRKPNKENACETGKNSRTRTRRCAISNVSCASTGQGRPSS